MEATKEDYRTGATRLVSMMLVGLVAGLAGCPGPGGNCGEPDPMDGNVGLEPALFPNMRIRGEPNDSFADPLEVVIDGEGKAHLAGTITTEDDVDVYALGPLLAGDRLIVEVSTPCSNLDPMLAIFDEQGRLAFENDDRNFDLGLYDAFMNDVLRRDGTPYFLAVTRSGLGTAFMSTGSYEVLITVVPGGDAPEPEGHTVVLDFDGGTIRIAREGSFTVDAFDTADIAPTYSGMTSAVRDQIAETVRENWEGLALDVLVAPGDSIPPNCDHSTVFFGGFSVDAFAVAQHVDPYNIDRCDDAIVFTETFSPAEFGRVLTAEELGIAIGNVASHEVGHLLGLNHVANVMDLMDVTGAADTFLFDQEFIESPLDDSIFPIGTQDGFLWLLETLGPTL